MHTPGPWKYFTTHPLSGDTWYVVTDNNGEGPIVDVGGRDMSSQIAEAKYLITNPKEIEANARLIAAAPELLEALEEMLLSHGYFNEDILSPEPIQCECDECTKARAAIAKAKGQS